MSAKAIANELIRRGKIIDQGGKYKIISFDDTLETSLLFIDNIRLIIDSINENCIKNNSKYLNKNDYVDIFNKANINNQGQLFNNNNILEYLIKQKILVDEGDNYKIIDLDYTFEITKKNTNLELMSSQLTLLSHTILFNAFCKNNAM